MVSLLPGSAGVLVAFLACVGCAGVAPDYAAQVDLTSKYVARGALLFDGPAVQPSASATIEQGGGSWSVGAWSTIDANDDGGNQGRFTEVDTYVEYERSLGTFTATLGLLRYNYPNTDFAASGEAHAALGYDNDIATPTLHGWYDYDQADGPYVSFDLARDFDLAEHWSLALSVSVGWMGDGQGAYYFGVGSSGFSDLTSSAALSFAPTEAVGLTLTLCSARVLDQDYRDAAVDTDIAWVMIGFQIGL